MAPTKTETHEEGDAYNVPSPSVPGYICTRPVLSGSMPGYDLVVTVIYIPMEDEDGHPTIPRGKRLTVLDDYETPLGLGEVFINVGDCFE